MYTYIKIDISEKLLVLDSELDSNLFNVGTTFEDYLSNMFVPLSQAQCDFANNNPTASVEEIWNMTLNENSLMNALCYKLSEIDAYDSSSEVNEFFYQNQSFWLDKDTRVGLMNSTTILMNAGESTTTLWFGNMNVTLPCASVIQMLSALEIYALECYNVTALHKSQVNAMTDIDEINAFDVTIGYPEKLSF